jgi:biotin carboxylase
MKKLLVLGAGLLQIPVIKKARKMGYYVIATDDDPNAPGMVLANKAIVPGGLMNEEKMVTIAKEEQIDGVIHPCSEVAMNVMGRINDELGLCGISKEIAIRATNKHLMREAFEKYGAPSPKSILTKDEEDAWATFYNEFDTNAILKPSRNSGSRGIAKVEKGISKESFIGLYRRALDESRDHQVLIEQFIEGPEFSVEVIVWQGNPHVLAVTDKKTTEAPYFVELGHNQPSVFPLEIQNKLKDGAIAGCKALGLTCCAAHCELKVQNGEAYLMEIGARMGGDFISTELTHLSSGIDMVAATINVVLGIEPNLTPTESKHGVCIRYFTPRPGIVDSIENEAALQRPNVYDAEIYVRPGDEVREVKSSLDRSGHVIVTAETVKEAITNAELLIKEVKINTMAK